ncbi:MAG: metallophosphoesterase family protein [Dehalococcoidia bacterium]|nr:metallophosphoesterase family protein [Dehalococcoidia bacterium]
MVRVGVISDTHLRHFSQLPQELVRILEKVDLIMHAGDIVTMDVIEGLKRLAPVHGVCGNMDLPEVRNSLPQQQLIELEGKKIGIVHGSGGPAGLESRVMQLFAGADAVVFGHSHIATNITINGVLLFNPGRANESYGLLEVGEIISSKIVRAYY